MKSHTTSSCGQSRKANRKPSISQLLEVLEPRVFLDGDDYSGENLILAIDPARSSLTVSGSYGNLSFIPQGGTAVDGVTPPFSLSAIYSGIISASRQTGLDTLQITGGSIVAGGDLPWYPAPAPVSPANYGFEVTSDGFDGFYGAIRLFQFSIYGPSITSPATFDAALLSGSIISGRLDVSNVSVGSYPLSSNLVLASNTCSLTNSGGIETLSIPIGTDFSVLVDGQPLALHLTGVIVASTPEPSSLTLILVPMLMLYRRHSLRQTRQ